MMSPIGRILRQPRHATAATALIVVTLALAVGANTAVFSVADALLFRAVPFPAPDRLVTVTSAFPGIKLSGMNLSGPEALEFQALTTAFAGSGPFGFTGLVVRGATEAELANGVEVSRGALEALGIRPVAGRLFEEAEYRSTGPAVVILGHGLWTRAYGADPGIVGRVVQLGGESREVVGIMPARITLLNRAVDLWLPLTISPGDAGSRSDHRYNVVARLAAGRSIQDAAADVHRAMDVWREETGEMHVPTAKMHPLELQPLTLATTGLNREPIGALVAAVAFVLLIACANIANLQVARADARRADTAIQLALGASRSRLLADSLAEGLLLAGAGGLGGLLIASLILEMLVATWPAVANANLSIDARVLTATGILAAVTGILIGAAPVARLDPANAGEWLKTGTRGRTGAPSRLGFQRALIALQIALAVLLSASAGLMIRSLLALTSVESGIRTEQVLRALISLPDGAYPDDRQVWSFYDRVLETLRASPGLARAAVMSGLPPQRRANNTSFFLDGVEVMDHSAIHQVDFIQHVSEQYVGVLSIPLREGRLLGQEDDERAAPVALVNEALAKRFWPTQSALGHRLKPAGNIGTWFTIVGVVADVRQNGIQSPVGTEMYVTHRQARQLMSGFMPRSMNLLVESGGSLDAAAASVRNAVRQVDPNAAVSGIAPMGTIVDRTIAQPRLLAWMFTGFAVLALVVAGVGVYAVTAYTVGSRTMEFGVRMALGATPGDVLRLVVAGGLPTMAVGIVAGSMGAVAAGRLVRTLLFGIEPLDPASLVIGAVAIMLSAFAATLLPARRASRVDPLIALRDSRMS